MTLDLPDVPRWVEAHGIAADPAHWRRPLGAGFAVGHDAARLAVIVGDADPVAAAELARTTDVTLLFAAEREDLHAALVATRPVTRAILHTLDVDPPEHEGTIVLPDDAPVPEYLADEIAWARTRGPVYSVYLDGAPAAFAYAPWRSATLFDVSVDVIPGARQLGLGSIAAAGLIYSERPRRPVWGADEGNAASRRLAARLGFTAVDEIWVAPAH